MITSAISSAVDAMAFLTTSSVIGSTQPPTPLDVAVVVEGAVRPGDDARRVGLVDEQAAPAAGRPRRPERLRRAFDAGRRRAEVRPTRAFQRGRVPDAARGS